jgi:ABC-type uncharacterized transport system involved in gliding motility auxiliary subunit
MEGLMSKISKRNLLLGGGTFFGVIVVLAIIVVIQYLLVNHPKRWDLTGTNRYTLAPQSKKILDNFKEKKVSLEVLAFFETKELGQRDQAKDLFDQYRDYYSEFTYRIIDPDKDRTAAIQNKIENYPTIIVKEGTREERITTLDEESLTNSLVKLMRSEPKKVYFLKGHGELSATSTEPEGFSAAKAFIEKQNYKTEELVLLQAPEIPPDANLVIIAGPKTDPLEPEFESLKRYLQRGGSLLVL